MCGIAGLFLKNAALEPRLGALMTNMLNVLTERGPDSAGFAIYGAATPGHVKFTVRVLPGFDVLSLPAKLDATVTVHDDHAVISAPTEREAEIRAILERHPEIAIVSVGSRMELFKGIGLPEQVGTRFGLSGMSGTHAIGHTRMATEISRDD